MKLFFLSVTICLASRCFSQTRNDSLHLKKFSVTELQEDMDSLHSILAGNHPDLWRFTDKSMSEQQWQAARKNLSRSMTRWEFIKIVAPLVNQYNDAHTNLSYDFDYEEVEAMMKKNGRLFPWKVIVHNDKVWVQQHKQENDQETYNVLVSINKISIGDILKTLMPLTGGDHLRNQEVTLCRLFPFFLWASYGWEKDFDIVTVDSLERKIKIHAAGISVMEYAGMLNPTKDWSMKLYLPQSLAVIECLNYRNEKKARLFIDSAFSVIKEQHIENVAFDIRRNGGGSSSIGDYFLAHITAQNYTDVISKTIREGSIVKKFKEGSWVNDMLKRYKKDGVKDGDNYTITFSAKAPDSLSHPENFFSGKFYLLAGPATYSSAHMTALAVKCYHLGTIIGQPTGEHPDLTGETSSFRLRNTGLTGYCATAVYKAACNDSTGMLQPDILIPLNEKYFAGINDPEIDYLIQSLSVRK